MASISEFVEDGRLQCGSVNHPPGQTRDTMFFLTEKNGMFCFGCNVCTELTRKPQLHILADSRETRAIHSQTRKARHIERDKQGNIVSFR